MSAEWVNASLNIVMLVLLLYVLSVVLRLVRESEDDHARSSDRNRSLESRMKSLEDDQ